MYFFYFRVSKRPRTAFFLFSNENRETVKAQNPTFKTTDVARELGRLWSIADETIKSNYQKQSIAEREEYHQKMSIYRSNKAAEERALRNDQSQYQLENHTQNNTTSTEQYYKYSQQDSGISENLTFDSTGAQETHIVQVQQPQIQMPVQQIQYIVTEKFVKPAPTKDST